MRDADRIPIILAAIERAWRRDPDTRLGQLLVNLLREHQDPPREEGMRLFGLPDGELLRWLGPQTDAENTYVSEEPHRAREGWRAREKDWRESNAYQEWLNKTRHRPGPQS